MWVVIISILVFLIVFFVSWGLRVTVFSALALASAITLLFMWLLYPPISLATNFIDTADNPVWSSIYSFLMFLFLFYVLVYVVYMSIFDMRPKEEKNLEGIEMLEGSYSEDQDSYYDDESIP